MKHVETHTHIQPHMHMIEITEVMQLNKLHMIKIWKLHQKG